MPKQPNKPATDCAKDKKYFLGPVANVFIATKTGVWRVVRPDVKVDDCIFCGTCRKHCPTDVVTVEKEGASRGVHFDWDYCKGCGICANVCPKQCIDMISEEGACKL